MARILIGWEFGANRGHALRIARMTSALQATGHEVVLAPQRIDALSLAETGGAAVWQAPVSPRLLVSGALSRRGPPAGMADILARLGMDDAVIVAAMIRGWSQLLGAVRPDLVIADFAPLLLLTARGRLPAISVGTGFEQPPAGLDRLPPLLDGIGEVDQPGLLAQVNAGIAATGGTPIDALPQMFGADHVFVTTFTELDPYAESRDAVVLPLPADFDAAAGAGEEVFVYGPERIGPDAPLWRGLAESGLPVRVYVLRAPAEMQRALRALGLIVEPEPLPLNVIAERSRLLVSHGGHGFVCAGLAAGLPHVVCHPDLEKLLYGRALARLQLGGHVAMAAIEPKAFAASLVKVYRDDALAARAKAAAPGFRRRAGLRLDQAMAKALAAVA